MHAYANGWRGQGVICLSHANDGWVAVSQTWVAPLEEVVARRPPYADAQPPPHTWTGKGGQKGTTQYTLSVPSCRPRRLNRFVR